MEDKYHPLCSAALHSFLLPLPPLFPSGLNTPVAQGEMVQSQMAQLLTYVEKPKWEPCHNPMGMLWTPDLHLSLNRE